MVNKASFFLVLFIIVFSLSNAFSKEKQTKNQSNATENVQISENKETNNSDASEENEETSDDAETNWQVLEWEEDNPEFVLKYEVVIQEYVDKTKSYKEINRLETKSNETTIRVEPLLPPGNYRFKVITYNLVGIAEVQSDWFNFKIFKAFQPEISNADTALTKSSTLYLEEFNDGIFSITGKNLFEPSKSNTDISFTNYYLENTRRKRKSSHIIPVILEHDDKNRHLKIQVNLKDLDTGTYHVVAEDASGLKSENTSKNEINVKYKKAVDFDLSAGYTIPVALYDNTFEKYLGTSVYPLSIDGKMSFMPFKHNFGYFGIGLNVYYTRLYSNFSHYSIDGNIFSSHMNFVYQLPVRRKEKKTGKMKNFLMMELHGGAGAFMLQDVKFNFSNGIQSTPLNSLNLSFDAGGAIQFYLTSRLFLEANVDYISPILSDMALGLVQPSINIGWQF